MNTEARAPARIGVVDDHAIVRLGIRQMIASDRSLTISWEADSAEAARRLMRPGEVDLAIVDLSLADGHGLELVRDIKVIAPAVPVLVLSMHDETLFAERALRAGARGYIMKQEAIHGLIDAIKQVLEGRVFLSDRVSQHVLERIGSVGVEASNQLGGLTDRELEVFDLIGRGLSTTAIADALNVSAKTVDSHRANIKNKLKLDDAAAVVRLAASWAERL